MIFAEPTSALDQENAQRTEQVLKASGAGLIWVTHDDSQPARVGGRVLTLPLGSEVRGTCLLFSFWLVQHSLLHGDPRLGQQAGLGIVCICVEHQILGRSCSLDTSLPMHTTVIPLVWHAGCLQKCRLMLEQMAVDQAGESFVSMGGKDDGSSADELPTISVQT